MVFRVGSFMREGGESCRCCYKTQRLFPHIEGLTQHLWKDLFLSAPCSYLIPSFRGVPVYLCFLRYIETREGNSHWLTGGGPNQRILPSLSILSPAASRWGVLILLPASWVSREDFTPLQIISMKFPSLKFQCKNEKHTFI